MTSCNELLEGWCPQHEVACSAPGSSGATTEATCHLWRAHLDLMLAHWRAGLPAATQNGIKLASLAAAARAVSLQVPVLEQVVCPATIHNDRDQHLQLSTTFSSVAGIVAEATRCMQSQS